MLSFSPFAMSVVHFTQDSQIIVSCFIILLRNTVQNLVYSYNSLVVRKKGESQNGCFKKTKPNFPINEYF